jgi:predicted transcriptional regulator
VSALTVRLPDDKHQRLKELAKRRHTSLNRLIDEMTTQMLAEFDAETRFLLRAERGKGKVARGLQILAKAKGSLAQHR